MKILLANPRGFCAGVNRAIEIVERALEQFGAPIYVRHEVVHNRFVVDGLKAKGAVFVDEVSEVPDGDIVIFSAHGVAKAVQREAQERGLKVFDATCPLVTKVHLEVFRHQKANRECILIGHAGHPEVEGTMGQYEQGQYEKDHNEGAGGKMYLVETLEDVERLTVDNPDELAYVTQTTLSMDDTAEIINGLRKRFPRIQGPKKDDICYATQNRQDAVKQFARECDVVLVVGSTNSSNSNRLRELAERLGARAYLIDNAAQINPEWLKDVSAVGVTAGASAPEVLVQEVIKRLEALGGSKAQETSGIVENVVFSLPKALA
ncbi:MAG: 4-hydroxy-3-methylbut-2-enyl diphosphate reductase [Gammaproteobacteria bacterium]|nr:4-hydroxy-3-methylbut-2-enyl diphosphate reductase [Gammaproteobacteria bacterium]